MSIKAGFEKISNKPIHSFLVRQVEVDKRLDFKAAFHYHPEYELTFTLSSKGRRFIGNHVENYMAGELIFIGKNIPHCWMTQEPSKQIVVQMTEDFLGEGFLHAPEMRAILTLFQDSAYGVQFERKVIKKVSKKLKRLLVTSPFNRLILLLEIFHDLTKHERYHLLSTEFYPTADNAKEFERINILLDYIHKNYQRKLSLDEAARMVNLTKSSLCKFIKKKTKKTFSQIVNEIRFGAATDMLIGTDLPILEICYLSGFNDPSFFFKHFLVLTGMTPKTFRDSYH